MLKSLNVNCDRMLRDLNMLASFGRCGSGVNRRSLSEIDMQSRAWLRDRMRDAALDAQIDGIGSVFGRTPHERRVLIGSHTDTVPEGGWLDGAMGVIYGLEIARSLMECNERPSVGVEVASFIDEEGHFLPLLGSQVFCGRKSLSDLADLKNPEGCSFSDARKSAGLYNLPIGRLDPAIHIAYLEGHIEQGPVLEHRRKKIGAVTGIVGSQLFEVEIEGQANHAGTTPMNLRQDAVAALIDLNSIFDAFCRENAGPDTVWTCNKLSSGPDAGNIVPGTARCTLHFRDVSSRILERLERGLRQACDAAANQRGVEIRCTKRFSVEPTTMEPALIDSIEASAISLDASCIRLPSGAGHDAMFVGTHIPAGMIFIPSLGGLSHSTNEDSLVEDIKLGLNVMAETVVRVINANS